MHPYATCGRAQPGGQSVHGKSSSGAEEMTKHKENFTSLQPDDADDLVHQHRMGMPRIAMKQIAHLLLVGSR